MDDYLFNAITPGKTKITVPKFRSTVYWNPSVKTDAMGKVFVEFYVSDDVGLLRVVIEGISQELQPFSISTERSVVLINTT